MERSINENELAFLESQKKRIKDRKIEYTFVAIFLSIMLLVPKALATKDFLSIDFYLYVFGLVGGVILMVSLFYRLWNKSYKKKIDIYNSSTVLEEVFSVNDVRITRANISNKMGFFFTLDNKKTLIIHDDHYSELQNISEFPNTRFKLIYTKEHKKIVGLECLGEYLEAKEVRKLELSMELQTRILKYKNWSIVDENFERAVSDEVF